MRHFVTLIEICLRTPRLLRRIFLDELSFEIRLERRNTRQFVWTHNTSCAVFILEMHNQVNFKCLAKFVQTDNASSV